MPAFVVTCRGGLTVAKKLHPTGAVLEMSEAEAKSLPAGTVEAAKAAPPATHTPTPVAKATKEKKP